MDARPFGVERSTRARQTVSSTGQIAERLYISRRTVEAHITHIFRKLGLDNRTRLAAADVARAG